MACATSAFRGCEPKSSEKCPSVHVLSLESVVACCISTTIWYLWFLSYDTAGEQDYIKDLCLSTVSKFPVLGSYYEESGELSHLKVVIILLMEEQ